MKRKPKYVDYGFAKIKDDVALMKYAIQFNFHQDILVIMEDKGITIKQLSKLTNISFSKLKNILLREKLPSIHVASKICFALDCKLTLNVTENPKSENGET